MRRIGLLFLCLFAISLSKAQDHPDRIPPYYYFFEMTQSEVIEMRHRGLDPHRVIHDRKPADSCLLGTMQPAQYLKQQRMFGYFVMLLYTAEGPQVQQLENPFAEIRLFKFDHEYRIMMLDSTGFLKKYTLKTESDSFYYDPSCACIKIDSKRLPKGNFILQKGNNYMVFHDSELRNQATINNSNTTKVYKRKWWKFWKRPRGPRSTGFAKKGFVILNQAEYRINDSLHAKAYLMDKKGRPYSGDVHVAIQNSQGRHYFFSQAAKNLGHGTYTFDWQVPDSIFMDQNYTILFQSNKKEIISKFESFKVTHYSFVDYELGAKLKSPYLFPNDTNQIILSAKDKNGIPLTGTKVQLTIRLQSLGLIHIPFLNLSNKQLTAYLDTSFYMGPDNETLFPLIREMFPPMEHSLRIDIVMTTPNNERQTFNLYLTRKDELVNYNAEYKGDDLEIQILINEKSTVSDSVKIQLTDKYFSSTYIVHTQLPYTLKNYAQFNRIVVLDSNNRVLYSTSIGYGAPQLNGTKTNDSLFFHISNPSHSEYHWEVVYDDKTVKTGNSAELAMKLKGDKTAQVYLYHVDGKNLSLSVFHIYPKQKELTILHTIPSISYPGQRINAEIKVLDFYGNPVKNANLTAFSINQQLPVLPNPQIPYFGTNKPLPYQFSNFYLPDGSKSLMRYSPMDSSVYQKFKLDRFIDYRIYFKPGGFHQEDVKTQNGSSQLQALCYEEEYFGLPYEVWVDGELKYLSIKNKTQPSAFVVKEGLHRIQIRTKNAMVELDSIKIGKGIRSIIGINPRLLINGEKGSYTKLEPKYEDQEIEKIEEHILWFISDLGTQHSFIKQGDQLFSLENLQIEYDRSIGTSLQGIAPLKEGMVEYLHRDTSFTFYFNPENTYQFRNKKLESKHKQNNLLRANYFNSLYGQFKNVDAIDIDSVHRLWHYLDSLKNLVKPPIHQEFVAQPIQNSGLFTNFHLTNDRVNRLNILSMQDSTYQNGEYNFYWLENLAESKHSVYMNTSPTTVNNIEPGYYRLVYGRYLKETFVIDSLWIEANQNHYVRIDLFDKKLSAEEFRKMQYRYFLNLQRYGNEKTPLFDTEPSFVESKGQNINSEVNGWISIDYTPARNAYLLFVSQNSKESYMARTNNEGFFNYYDMKPGKYFTHIISSNRQVFLAGITNLESAQLKSFNFYCFTDLSKAHIGNPSYGVGEKFHKSKYTSKKIPSKEGALSGIISTEGNGEPIPFVNISLFKDGSLASGGITNIDGRYSIESLKPGKYFLSAKYIGMYPFMMREVEIVAGEELQIDIQLKEQTMNLSEVQVKSYYDQTENLVSGAYSSQNRVNSYAPSNIRADAAYKDVESYSLDMVAKTSSKKVMSQLQSKTKSEFKFNSYVDEKSRMADIKQDIYANGLRSEFKTNAYWKPLILTDKEGRASFSFQFPGDQTNWVHYFAAIDRKHNTRLNITYTKSYKPLSASVKVPDFAVEGDQIDFKNQVRNLTGDSIQVKLKFKADSVEQNWSVIAGTYYMKELSHVFRNENDTTVFEFSLDYDGYRDGEQRKVKVLSSKVPQRKVRTYILGRGENMTIPLDQTAISKTIKVNSGLYDLIEEEIEFLRSYDYGCVEQTASKLIALVYEKQLKTAYGEEFKGENDIKKMIDRLEDFQHKSGGFGWWKGSAYDEILTLYAAKALTLASKAGYKVKGHKRAVGALLNQYSTLITDWKLATLVLASELDMKFDYEAEIKKFSRYKLHTEAKMSFIELQLRFKKSIDLSEILEDLVKDNNGFLHIKGKTNWGFNSHHLTLTLHAYRVLKLAGGNEEKLVSIRKYVFNQLTAIQRNTFERAAIISTLCDDALQNRKDLLKVKVGDKEIMSRGTYEITGQGINIRNLGEQVSIIIQENSIQEIDKPLNEGISIASKFGAGSQSYSSVKAGEIVNFNIVATTREHHTYLVLDIPIPAGFKIIGKPEAQGNEAGREYFEDRIVIYFKSLPKGQFSFNFSLLPQFTGNFTLLPAWMEDMYNPNYFGCEKKTKVKVY